MESTKPTLNESENGNKSKPLLANRLLKYRAFVRNSFIVPVLTIDFNNEFITWDDNQYDRCVPPNKCYEIESFDQIKLLEFIGLRDINGKEIYKGDKLIHEGYSVVLVVVFVKGEFKLQRIDYFESGRKLYSEIKGVNYRKIIGNVFENKELL